MEDNQILDHIKSLTKREEDLWIKENISGAELQELHKIKLELDQYWDLLRQKKALRNANENPDKAQLRDIETIENYKN